MSYNQGQATAERPRESVSLEINSKLGVLQGYMTRLGKIGNKLLGHDTPTPNNDPATNIAKIEGHPTLHDLNGKLTDLIDGFDRQLSRLEARI